MLHVVHVGTRNITLSVEEEILREAKLLAAEQGISVSALLRRQLQALVHEQRGFTRARQSALRRLVRGTSLGGGPLPARDELHDRAKLR